MAFFHPMQNWNGKVVLWVHGDGKAELYRGFSDGRGRRPAGRSEARAGERAVAPPRARGGNSNSNGNGHASPRDCQRVNMVG